jgi:hypothetical protein
MCLPTYGSDSFLRFQLRNKMKAIKEDDRRVMTVLMEVFNCS